MAHPGLTALRAQETDDFALHPGPPLYPKVPGVPMYAYGVVYCIPYRSGLERWRHQHHRPHRHQPDQRQTTHTQSSAELGGQAGGSHVYCVRYDSVSTSPPTKRHTPH